MKWRLIIDSNPRKGSENMAIDSALQQLCKRPTLRLYRWDPFAVSIGRFQSLKDEVDVDFCKKEGIDIIRRVTGGGAVFHENEITYSVSINQKNEYFSENLHDSYNQICSSIIKGLSMYGLNGEYVPINDIIVNGKKISGCAQTRKNGIILHHGTILIDVNIEKMFRILKVPQEKIKDKLINDVKKRVTSLREELGKDINKEELINNIVQGFRDHFNIEFEESELTKEEKQLSKEIRKNVFENPRWSYER